MVKPLTTQSSYLAQTGQMELYRSGRIGRLHNDGDVRQINGFAIDVTGSTSKVVMPTAFTPGVGIQTVKAGTPPSLLASSTLAAAIQLQGLPDISEAQKEAVKAGDGSAYVTSIGEVKEMYFTPVGAESQAVEGLGFLPGHVLHDRGAKIEYVKSQIARAGELARIEKQMSAEHGVDVKLAFDPMAGEYVMLRPGQPGYDQVKSAQDVFDRMVLDARRMGDGDAYREVLARYGAVI